MSLVRRKIGRKDSTTGRRTSMLDKSPTSASIQGSSWLGVPNRGSSPAHSLRLLVIDYVDSSLREMVRGKRPRRKYFEHHFLDLRWREGHVWEKVNLKAEHVPSQDGYVSCSSVYICSLSPPPFSPRRSVADMYTHVSRLGVCVHSLCSIRLLRPVTEYLPTDSTRMLDQLHSSKCWWCVCQSCA